MFQVIHIFLHPPTVAPKFINELVDYFRTSSILMLSSLEGVYGQSNKNHMAEAHQTRRTLLTPFKIHFPYCLSKKSRHPNMFLHLAAITIFRCQHPRFSFKVWKYVFEIPCFCVFIFKTKVFWVRFSIGAPKDDLIQKSIRVHDFSFV